MKTIMFFLMLVFLSVAVEAQSVPDFDNVQLARSADYKTAEPFVMAAANFLLNEPIDQYKEERLKAIKFLSKWMRGAPDFSFSMDGSQKHLQDDISLMGIYLAATTKYTLQNKTAARDLQATKLSTWKIILEYCEKPANNVKKTKKLKKLIEANAKGELAEAL